MLILRRSKCRIINQNGFEKVDTLKMRRNIFMSVETNIEETESIMKTQSFFFFALTHPHENC
jgi:hypothetical protein